MVVLGGWAFSCERGTPVVCDFVSHDLPPGALGNHAVHEAVLGGGSVSYERGTPVVSDLSSHDLLACALSNHAEL